MNHSPQCSLKKTMEKIKMQQMTTIDLVQSSFDHINRKEKEISAWSYIDKEKAMELANKRTKEANQGHIKGPLHGIPIGIKDNMDVKGMPTRLGSKLWKDREPATQDALIVQKLKEMGAIIIGKTHMTEYAWLDPTKTKNPHNLNHTPGGSSSGSAAAVASAMVPISLGSQTAASVCRPAAYCGIGGFKPTPTSLFVKDVKPLAQSFDTIGFFATYFEDLTFFVNDLLPNHKDELTDIPHFSAQKFTIGMISDILYETASISIKQLQIKFTNDLLANHYQIEHIHPFEPFQLLIDCHKKIIAYEAAMNYQKIVQEHTPLLGNKFINLVNDGLNVSTSEYKEAQFIISEYRERFWKDAEHIDFFIIPPVPTTAPGLETTGDPRFTIPWTVLGGPLAVIPKEVDDQGLPLAIMFASAPGTDKKLLHFGRQIEHYVIHKIKE